LQQQIQYSNIGTVVNSDWMISVAPSVALCFKLDDSHFFHYIFFMSLLKKMASVLSTASPFKLALVQLGGIGAEKTKNLAHTREKILEAAKNGANVVVLPVSPLYKVLIEQLTGNRNASTRLMAQVIFPNMLNL
jgi:hypothetical protein